MSSGAYHSRLSVKSIGSAAPAWRCARYANTSHTASARSSAEPVTITVRICVRLREIHSPSIIMSGMAGKSDSIFIAL